MVRGAGQGVAGVLVGAGEVRHARGGASTVRTFGCLRLRSCDCLPLSSRLLCPAAGSEISLVSLLSLLLVVWLRKGGGDEMLRVMAPRASRGAGQPARERFKGHVLQTHVTSYILGRLRCCPYIFCHSTQKFAGQDTPIVHNAARSSSVVLSTSK